jgi:AcrR family transcriptional regulator
MPKLTFDNLPVAKRQTIIDIALAEFAEQPYGLASVSRIVERAQIAKGSLYQYFEHKQDLYLFLLDYAAQAQLVLLRKETPPDSEMGFFALLRWQMSASVRVGLAAPLLTQLMYRASTDNLPFHDEVVQRLQAAGEGHLRQLLVRGIERGEIDPAIDLELAAFMLRSLMSDLRQLIGRRIGVSPDSAAHDTSLFDSPAIEQIYDQIVHVLQYGLSPISRPRNE